MPSRSAGALLVVLALLLVAGPAAGLGPSDTPGAAPPSVGPGAPPVATIDVAALASHNGTFSQPEQVMRVDVGPRGNARWQVSARFRLETRNDTAAFQEIATRFESEGTDYLALDTFEEAATRAGAESGRSMRVRNVTRSHSIDDDSGVLVLSFTWTNFAETSGDRLIVGDAFNTSTGTWLPYLNDHQTLLVAPPEGYGVLSSPPVAVENGVARWNGPIEFTGRGPWIVYAGSAGTETPPTTTPPTTTLTTTGPGPGNGSSSLMPLVLVAIVGGGVAVIGAYVLRRGPDGVPGAIGGSGSNPGGEGDTSADDATGSSGGTDSPDESAPGSPVVAGGAADETTSADADRESPDESDDVDVTLLSDEERVERLLEQNGGRMKQASIVKETGWSNAKVSQLLSAMAEDDRIDKLRIGRENLISFPDEAITDLDSDSDFD